VIDYGMGNRRSVEKAIERAGATVVLSGEREKLAACDGLVLPGVGAFPLAMRRLREGGLERVVHEAVSSGVPILGICLGMQLLFERSDELDGASGLGLLGGEVTALRTEGLRVPHIGWNEVTFERPSPLTEGLPARGCPFYHVHSFAARPSDPADVVGSTEYGERFATFVARDNVFGVQFHPEKSSAHGLTLLSDFTRLCARAPAAAPA
jgi:glutamine amidotransferase